MPAVAQYPTPTDFGGPGGPYWATYHYEGPAFKVYVGPEYGDGSRDRNYEGAGGVHRWVIEYDARVADLDIIDQHYQSACGQAYGFNFYCHRVGALFTNCHYESCKRSKGKNASRAKRQVVIVCEPA